MTDTRPFLCRVIGWHSWAPVAENNAGMTIHRCQRPGCHRQKMDLGGDAYVYDKVLCSCGAEIVHLRDNFWRRVDSGEVCYQNHWHEPAR